MTSHKKLFLVKQTIVHDNYAGDLNADILPGSSCPEGRALMDLCNSLYLRVVTRYIFS